MKGDTAAPCNKAEVKDRSRSFGNYSAYGPDHGDWFGKVPSHWSARRLKHLASMQGGDGITADSIDTTGEFPVYGGNGLRGSTSRYTHDGDYVLVGRQGALCGNVHRVTGRFWASEHAVVATCHRSIETDWFAYLLRGMNLNRYSESAAQPGLSMERVLNLRAPLPPRVEQRAIAAFLDRETSRIDALIAKKERLIELLQEKRTALISHAVTKGLDPKVVLVLTPHCCFRQIPAHWGLMRLRHMSPHQTVGVVVNPSSYFAEEGIPFLLGNNIAEGGIDLTGVRFIAEASNRELYKSMLRAGDVIVVRVGDPGVAAVVPPELDRCNCASMMIVRQGPKLDSHWLCYAFNSRPVRAQVDMVKYGAAQKQFNISHAVNFWFAVPPKTEQLAIVRYLDESVGELEQLAGAVREAIDRLREYRSALISAAVTGKIDVRGEVDAGGRDDR